MISDGSQSMSATIAGAHIAGIAGRYSVDLLEARMGVARGRLPQVDARVRVEYNPNLVETWFSGLLEVFNQVTMIAMLLAAAAMVREREHGTMEHLLVSPLRSWELFTAKVVPVVVLVPLAALGSVFGIVHGVFATPIRGSVALFYAVTVIYVFALASLGLAIAVVARNLGQAMLLLLLILYPMMLLSGAFTPPESMGPFMRYASLVSPVRHYVDFGYQVLFKGNGLAYVWPDVLGILGAGRAAVRDFHPALRAARALTRPTGAGPPAPFAARPPQASRERRRKVLKSRASGLAPSLYYGGAGPGRSGRYSKEAAMLWTIVVILLVLWALGMLSAYTAGGLVHLLLVIAIIVVVVQFVSGRRSI